MIAVSSVIIAACRRVVNRIKSQYHSPSANVMHAMVMSLRKRKEVEIFIAAASTIGQPGGQMLTNDPLKVCRNPVAQLRATETYSSLSPPGTQYGLSISK